METALNEITLVLFTTIAPAGVMGYLTMALAIVLSRDEERAAAISRYLVVPLVLAISGLIASATHLGTPANALYVITGIGRSPLSNEVVAAVAFLALGGVYWILSFRDDLRRPFRVAWLAATAAAGFVFVGYIAVAYSVPSVPTWNLPTAPLTLWLNALSSGPLVGLFGLLLARQEPNRGMVAALLALAAAGAPEVYKLAARRFLGRAKSHMASWLYILLDSFLTPVAGLFRVLLGAAAVKSLPFELVRDAVFLQYLNLAADLLVIFYISLGCWRAAPVTRLLLRSAQNHLDLETNQTMGHFFENIFHALVGLFAGIAMLDRLGVPVSGLLTGAGVAGLAVSLAAQSTLNNLIAGITLVLERPFGIGDYIVLGDCEGTVEDISFRSTRIRSPDNVAITIENSKITAEYIQNYDRRQSRLWKFTIGLTYDTPREKIEHLTADLTAMLQAQPDVQPDGVTIALDKFNDYSIDLACRVYITKVNLRDFMQVKNTLNLHILDLMQEEGCEFAFPTTTVDFPERM